VTRQISLTISLGSASLSKLTGCCLSARRPRPGPTYSRPAGYARNGRGLESSGGALNTWAYARGVQLRFIDPAS
jgi:hypothetical protein